MNKLQLHVELRNKQILLVRRPNGLPQPEDFRLEETTIDYYQNHPLSFSTSTNTSTSTGVTFDSGSGSGSGSDVLLILKTMFVSIDPAMRGWMSTAKSYLPPVQIGSVMRASTISKVIASDDGIQKEFPVGSIVRSEIVGVQSYFVIKKKKKNRSNNNNNYKTANANKILRHLTRLDTNTHLLSSPPPPPQLSSSSSSSSSSSLSFASYLGVLGITGLTAYFGLLRVGQPKASDTILVSGAAGATGSIVAQIAKHVVGCKLVIGTAGTDEKCAWLEQNHIVDVAINYKKKSPPSLSRAIRNACKRNSSSSSSDGVDVVFDNVGSEFLEAALSNLATKGGARIVLCGAISQYNNNDNENNSTATATATATGPRNYMNLLVKRATMKGFVVFDYQSEYPTAIRDLTQWISQGKIPCYKEDMRHVGIENFYPALMSLFTGTNMGKVVLKVPKIDNNDNDNEDNDRENDDDNDKDMVALRSKL